MGHVAAEVLANDDMPCWVEASVELLLDLRSDVLLNVVLLERGSRDVDGLLLHLLAHVDVLDDGLGHLLARGREVADGRGRCRVAFLSHCRFYWCGEEECVEEGTGGRERVLGKVSLMNDYAS